MNRSIKNVEGGAELRAKAPQLVSVRGRQPSELAPTRRREREPVAPAIVLVDPPRDETGLDRPIDELDDAVVLQLERSRDVTDRGSVDAGCATDGEQQLMLVRRDPGRARGVVGEAGEHAERVAKAGERLVVAVG